MKTFYELSKKEKKNPVTVLMLSMQQVKNKDKNSMQW